eukprot:scaffold58910_cov65-Phaeocystis_antarctica.AAC.2
MGHRARECGRADLRVFKNAPSRRLGAVPKAPFCLVGGCVEGLVVGEEPLGVAPPSVLAHTVPLGVGLSALRESAGPRLRVTRREDRRQGLRAGAAGHAPPSCGADHVGRARAARARLDVEGAGIDRAYWVDAEERPALHDQVLAGGALEPRVWHQSEEQVAAHQLVVVCVLEVDRRDEGPRLGRAALRGDGRGRLGQGDDDLVDLRRRA